MPDDGSTSNALDDVRSTLEDAQPPPELEDRVVTAAREEGWIVAPERTSAPWTRGWRLAATAILTLGAFGIGYLVAPGPISPPAPGEAGETYVLLLHETESSAPTDPDQLARLVREYGDWGRRLGRAGVVVGGEKLDVGGVVLDATGGDLERRPWTREPGFLGGYFLIRAGSYDEAAAIARTCPHLAYGGEIEIRRVE